MRAIAIILICALSAAAEEAKPPVLHEGTGIWLPSRLGELPLTSIDDSDARPPATGYVFSHPSRPINASLYITELSEPPSADETENRIRYELARSMASLEALKDSGRYESLHLGNVRRSGTDLAGLPLIVLDSSFTYSFPDETTKSLAGLSSVRSFIATTIYRGHLCKLRYTEPAGARWTGSADPDIRAEAIFASFIDLFREHALRPQVDKALHAYRKEPFSDKGLMAAAFLFTFADESALAAIDLGQEVLDYVGYGSDTNPDPSATRHLLNAYVIGNFAQQYESEVWTDQPEAGRHQVQQTYRALQKRDSTFSLPHLDQLSGE